MKYRDLRDFLSLLEEKVRLKRITFEIDPYLEMTEIADRTLRAGGPALLFENPERGLIYQCYVIYLVHLSVLPMGMGAR